MNKILTLIVFALFLALFSCKKDEVYPSVSGNWVLYKYKITDTADKEKWGEMTKEMLIKNGMIEVISFESDNKFLINYNAKGAWEQNKDSVFITEGEETILKGQIVGVKLHIDEPSGDTTNKKSYEKYISDPVIDSLISTFNK